MNKNVMIVLAGGAMVAILVAMLMSVVLSGGSKKNKKDTVQQVARIEILVAQKSIDVGKKLTEKNVQWKKWPQDGTFSGTIKRKSKEKLSKAIESTRLTRSVVQGEPITKSAMLQGDANFITATLKPGMRAIAIKVSAKASVGGFVNPGNYVDIIMSYKQTIRPDADDEYLRSLQKKIIEENLGKHVVETIMENIKVLAVDQVAYRAEQKAKVGKTVTVEVTPRQAEILFLAQVTGSLRLSLRGLGDNVVLNRKDPVMTDERLTTIYDEVLQEFNRVRDEAGIEFSGVKIYEGAETGTVQVR